VISSDPVAGTSVVRGSTVQVTVSLGLPFVTVPDVAGLPIPDAIEQLRSAGFGVVVQGDAGATVLATRPQANESIRQGSEVEIISTRR
jgi:serine/threonine-protein kinase